MDKNHFPGWTGLSPVGKMFDRYLGRGSYYWLKDRIHPQREYTQLTYARLIAEKLKPETRWLEAGGGHQVLEVQSPDAEQEFVARAKLAVCCDRQIDAIAKHRSIRVGVGAELDRLPFRERSIDLITLNNVAEHLERPRDVLLEFARVLSPGGSVIIHTPNVHSYAVRIAEMGRHFLPRSLIMRLIRFMDFREEHDVFPTFYRVNARTDLMTSAASAGLAVEKLLFVPARPLFYFAAPLCAVELAASRLLLHLGAEDFAASVILAVLRKPTPRSD